MFSLLCFWKRTRCFSTLLCSAKKMISSHHPHCGLPLISLSLLRQRRSKGSYRQRRDNSAVASDHRLPSQPPLRAPRLLWYRTSAVLSRSAEAPASSSALRPPPSPTLSSPSPTPHSSFHYVLLLTSVPCIPSVSCSSLFSLPHGGGGSGEHHAGPKRQ
jgi:hypothetical protein